MKTPDYAVTYDETPENLTTGKRYPVIDDIADAVLLVVSNDEGNDIVILTTGCAHLRGGKWKLGYTFYV